MKFDPVSYAMGIQASGSGSDLSDATATRADILYPKTAYLANGRKNVGTIQSIEAATYTPSASNQTIAAGKYIAGDQVILGDSNLIADNIKKNVSIFGITGNYTGELSEDKTVHFTDYDGTIVYAYTPEEFASLTELPANPTHEGLIGQGWNWDIVEAQEYVAEFGGLDIGQMYVTASGKTEVDIELEEPFLTPYLSLSYNGATIIDWGDGNTTTVTGSGTRYNSHTYVQGGKYTITIDVKSSYDEIYKGLLFATNNNYDNNILYKQAIKAVRLGNNLRLNVDSFKNCSNMEYITLPNTITSLGGFSYCSSLKYIVIPSSITTGAMSLFSWCINLQGASLPNKNFIPECNFMFSSCSALKQIYLPNVLTSMPPYMFNRCYSLKNIKLPSSITMIDTFSLSECVNLQHLNIPNKVTTIGSQAFRSNNLLKTISLPEGIATLTESLLYGCPVLTKITIPASVTKINSSAINNCYSLGEIHFLSTTPPTLTSSSAIANIPYKCIIYVPAGSLEAYTTATNYPSSSTYTYMEE